MSNVKISQLPEYTGNTSGSWLVMNDSGETTTYKVERETLLSGFQPSGNYATTGSNVFRGDQTITGSVNMTGSLNVVNSYPGVSPVFNTITANGAGGRNELKAVGLLSSNYINSTGSAAYNIISARGDSDTLNRIDAATNFISSSVLTKMVGNTEITGTLIVNTPGYLQTLIYGDSVETNGGTVEAGQFNSNFSVNLQALGTNSNVNISAPFGTGSIRLNKSTRITGSLNVTGSVGVTGSLFVSQSIGGQGNTISSYGGNVIYAYGDNLVSSSTINKISALENYIIADGNNFLSASAVYGTNRISALENYITGALIVSGSSRFNGNTSLTGSLYVSSSALLTNTISSVYNNIISSGPMTNNNNLISANGVTGYNKLSAYTNILEANTNIISGSLTVTGSAKVIGNTSLTGSLNVSGSDAFGWGITATSLRSNGTLGVYTQGTTTGPYMQAFNSNEKMQLNLWGSGSLGESLIVLSPTSSLSPYNFSIKTTQTGSLINSSDGQLIQFPSGSKSVNITTVMNLAPQSTLPTGTTGSLAVSGSGLYFHNGTSWNLIS